MDISVWGGLCPGFWARPQQTSTDPVKCESVATAHCVHPSIPLSPTVAGSLTLLTFLPFNRPHVLCVCRHMILAAYPGCRAAAGDEGSMMMRESRGHASIKVSCPGGDHGGWSRGRQPFLV